MTHKDSPAPTLALALSGGAARCIAHIGVLQAFEESGIPIDAIAGTSGGSMVGALYLDGMPLDELARLAAKTGWSSLVRPSLSRRGLLSSAGISRFMLRHLKARDIADLGRPFAAVCADLVTGEAVALTEGPLAKAVQASCSLPFVFTPTSVDGRLLIDGGFVSQIPVLAARGALNGSVVAAVDVNYKPDYSPRLGSLVGISLHLTQVYARRNALAEVPKADVVINVDIDGIGLMDIARHGELIRRGRDSALRKMDEVRGRLSGI